MIRLVALPVVRMDRVSHVRRDADRTGKATKVVLPRAAACEHESFENVTQIGPSAPPRLPLPTSS